MTSKSSVARADGRDPFAVAKDAMIVALCRADLSGAAHRVGVFLVVAYASRRIFEETGQLVAWPSIRTLARELGMFRGRLDRTLKALETEGFLFVSFPDGETKNARRSYTLQPAAKAKSGLTTVATSENESGLTDEATKSGESGLTDEATLASPVRTDLLEERLDGAGALSARPAHTHSDDVAFIVEVLEAHDQGDAIDVGARERAPGVPTVSDPDAWRADPDFSIYAAVNKAAGCAPEGAPAPEDAAEDDFDDEEDVIIPAPDQPTRDFMIAVFEKIYMRTQMDAPHSITVGDFVSEWVRGYVFGIPAARLLISKDTAQVIGTLKRLYQIDADEYMTPDEFSRDHLIAVSAIARKATADADSAARAVEEYQRDVAARVAKAQAKMEAAHA